MLIVYSHNRVPVRLTEERWEHIIRRHPEMAGQDARVLATLAEPETIQQGDFGELLAIRFYGQTPLTSKFLVVVYREVGPKDGFILTAYFTSHTSTKRKVLWKR